MFFFVLLKAIGLVDPEQVVNYPFILKEKNGILSTSVHSMYLYLKHTAFFKRMYLLI